MPRNPLTSRRCGVSATFSFPTAKSGTTPSVLSGVRLWPRSLLWRSVLLIAGLLVVANLAWVQIFRVAERMPRVRQTEQQIARVVNITRWALITADPAKRFDLLAELSKSE